MIKKDTNKVYCYDSLENTLIGVALINYPVLERLSDSLKSKLETIKSSSSNSINKLYGTINLLSNHILDLQEQNSTVKILKFQFRPYLSYYVPIDNFILNDWNKGHFKIGVETGFSVKDIGIYLGIDNKEINLKTAYDF